MWRILMFCPITLGLLCLVCIPYLVLVLVSSINWAQVNSFLLKMEDRIQSPKRFQIKTRQCGMSKNNICITIHTNGHSRIEEQYYQGRLFWDAMSKNPEYHNIKIQYESHIFIILPIIILARIYWTHSILGNGNDFHFT